MNIQQIKEIVSTYEKYDWTLRVFLLTAESMARFGAEIPELYVSAKIRDSMIDAAWFSRPSKHDREAWELRALREQPFALIETFPNDMDEGSREEIRNEMETRLAGSTS